MRKNTSYKGDNLSGQTFSVRLKRAVYILVVLSCFSPWCGSLSAQNVPHPSFRHYTTDDGLPSSEVYYILQDRDGYIWISTDNGVSRFDGYDFRNYGVKDGLLENVIFEMKLDSLERVWMQAMGGNLYYCEGDSIKPYWYNGVLLNYQDRYGVSKGFIIEGAGKKVHLSTSNYGIISIDENGKARTYPYSEPVYRQILEKHGQVISGLYGDPDLEKAKAYGESLLKQHRIAPFYIETEHKSWSFPDLRYQQIGKNLSGVFGLGKPGNFFFQYANNGVYIENGLVQWQHYFSNCFAYVARMKNGQIFGGLPWNAGLRVYQSTNDLGVDKGYTLLPGESVNFFMEDAEGGKWIATNENGVYYTPAETIRVHDMETGLSDKKITALAIKNDHELFAGLGNGEVWHHDQSTETWSKLPGLPGNGNIKDLYYDPVHEILWAGKESLCFYKKGQWIAAADILGNGLDVFYYGNRITTSPDGDRLWVSNHIGFAAMGTPLKAANPKGYRGLRTYVTREDFSGNVWVGQSAGLFEWKGNQLQDRRHLHPAFFLRVEDIAVMPDSTLVVATKGGGVVFWKGDQFEQITMENGLTADMLECLYADENGVVWAGTLNGLNRISGPPGHRKVEQITMKHGLPSNEISRVRAYGKEVWVATNRGLVHFYNRDKSPFSSKPRISGVLANNQVIDPEGPVDLTARQNNLTISYFAVNFRMNGKIPYRYRLDEGDWVETMSRSLNFPELPPGKRLFEVQAQNEDGVWSESTLFPFVIHPPWWKTWWAKTIFLVLFLTIGPVIYFIRTRQLKETHRIQMQITELERSALQAQMNPHFIFNCLNSIQNYILQNEKEAAMMYLGNFAGLVRSMLNASVAGKILLVEEIKLLNNYLELEKLRFKNRFDYEVKTENGIDIYEIELPPLLVQPYVENAVKHGIAGKKGGGLVKVHFQKNQGYIEVVISDNGAGIKPEAGNMESSKGHKSFGMSITSRRLDLLFSGEKNDAVSTKNRVDENGKISGTEVIIRIGISEDI
ncbi:MAG: histidine kinase [Saprospiraceae bacterium]|nr:histidine kinase [Saprospiraceae bacterium]MCB9324711.1 histidine kinase [Lewinellaceae bacterium]